MLIHVGKIDLNMKEASESLALPAVDVWYYICSSDKSFPLTRL